MASAPLVLDFTLGEANLRKITKGVFGLLRLGCKLIRVNVAPLSEDELEALVEPGARLLHGRKKLQAVLQKATDPMLLLSAAGFIALARLQPDQTGKQPAPSPRASAATAQQPSPVQGSPARPAAAPTGVPAGSGTLQDMDLTRVTFTPESTEAVLESIRQELASVGA